jgi:hypothetical protein
LVLTGLTSGNFVVKYALVKGAAAKAPAAWWLTSREDKFRGVRPSVRMGGLLYWI